MFTYKISHHRNVRKNFNQGFTLAEMMIVVVIMGVLLAIGSRTYFGERDRFEFNNALSKTLLLITTARTDATSNRPVYINSAIGNVIPADGYGLYVNLKPDTGKPNFVLFANVGPGPTREEYQTDDEPKKWDANDIAIETYTLPKQIGFQSLYFDEGNGDGLLEKWIKLPTPKPTETEAVMIFRPPLAEAFVGNNNLTDLEQVGMKFLNPDSPANFIRQWQCIRVSRVKIFPELLYPAKLGDDPCILGE